MTSMAKARREAQQRDGEDRPGAVERLQCILEAEEPEASRAGPVPVDVVCLLTALNLCDEEEVLRAARREEQARADGVRPAGRWRAALRAERARPAGKASHVRGLGPHDVSSLVQV